MKTYIIVLIGLLFLFSCGEKLIDKPDNLIPKDQMINILKDLAIVNAAKGVNMGVLKENGIEPTEYIFKKYAVDSTQFVDSDRYYASLPLEYESIYVAVEALLNEEKTRMDEEKKISDSLKLIQNKEKNDLKKVELKDTLEVKGRAIQE